jgi:hypothetical protein
MKIVARKTKVRPTGLRHAIWYDPRVGFSGKSFVSSTIEFRELTRGKKVKTEPTM